MQRSAFRTYVACNQRHKPASRSSQQCGLLTICRCVHIEWKFVEGEHRSGARTSLPANELTVG